MMKLQKMFFLVCGFALLAIGEMSAAGTATNSATTTKRRPRSANSTSRPARSQQSKQANKPAKPRTN